MKFFSNRWFKSNRAFIKKIRRLYTFLTSSRPCHWVCDDGVQWFVCRVVNIIRGRNVHVKSGKMQVGNYGERVGYYAKSNISMYVRVKLAVKRSMPVRSFTWPKWKAGLFRDWMDILFEGGRIKFYQIFFGEFISYWFFPFDKFLDE